MNNRFPISGGATSKFDEMPKSFTNRNSALPGLPGNGGTISFQYDPFGRRIEKISPANTTVYAYDGDNVVEELNGSGSPVAQYTQGLGIDEPLAMNRASATSFYQADGLGSVTSLTNGSGQIAASYTYDSFGNLTASTGAISNPLRFTARDYDSETGLYYYRARNYDPTVGRFLSEDPIGFSGGINRFRYVENNPISGVDPTGLTNPWNHFYDSQFAWFVSNNAFTVLYDDPFFYLSDVLVDLNQGVTAKETNRHAMAGSKSNGEMQTCIEARYGTAQRIADYMNHGQVGKAMHGGEDYGTPSHGGLPWYGWLDLAHIKGDWLDFSWQNMENRIHNDRWILNNLPKAGQTITPAMVMQNMRSSVCPCK